ncbi:MAG: FtsX-like permease family protein, partial [Bacteroidota bacterium]
MILGALGILIGTVGFGIILWRNNLERSGELALYMAIGFRNNFIRRMLMIEYLLILFAGMFLGIIGAVAGILPSLISPAYQMPGGFLLVILLVIWISGAVWILIPAQRVFKRDLTQILREE